MKTADYDLPKLSEYAKKMENNGYTDPISIIMHYAIDTNQEYALLDIIVKTAKARAGKAENQLNYARTWLPYEIDVYEGNKGQRGERKVTKEEGKLLNQLTKYCILGMEVPEKLLEEAKEVIPNMNVPFYMFRPTIEWLRDKYNIRFKDNMEENKNVKTGFN